MVSLMYPNVNKHIAPETRARLTYSKDNTQLEASQVLFEQVETPRQQARMSAPPPYSKEDPAASPPISAGKPSKKQLKRSQKSKTQPSLLLEVAIGYRLAKTLTEKRTQRKEARLEKVHDAWMQLGVDTRSFISQGGQLPPHFWTPPNYGEDEMSARLTQLGL